MRRLWLPMDKSILQVVGYFEVFSYPPTINELTLFLSKKVSPEDLERAIQDLTRKRLIYREEDRVAYHKSLFKEYNLKRKRSSGYYKKIANKLVWTVQIPFMQFVGISGSLSMMNMTEKGDIDIFIITTSQSLWTTRFIMLVYKYFLKVTDPDIGNKLCFNLFFSEDGLEIAKNKQNEYIGHEILQLKPLLNKNFTYEQFLEKNKWIVKIFPNVQINIRAMRSSKKLSRQPFYLNLLEEMLKKLQVWWLSCKNIKWDYHKGQLWLIQEDFEKNLKSNI